MNLMKILIIGGSSVIGWKLLNFLNENNIDVEFTYLQHQIRFKRGRKLDISKKDLVIKTILDSNPDVVIHTAALTNVDLCETNTNLADTVNVGGIKNIVEGCKNINSKLIYISTSFVFDGKKSKYTEDDKTSPSTYYGITKSQGENLVKNSGLKYLILRTDQPYCWVEKWQHSNSVLRVLQTLKTGRTMKEVVDWYNTPTYVPDFVYATKQLIDEDQQGIFHLVGSDFINRYDWAIKTAEIFGLNKNLLKKTKSDSLNLPAKRVNVNLSNDKLYRTTGIRMKVVKEGLLDMRKKKF